METTQVLLVLDLEGALVDADILAQSPPIQHHRVLIRLSSYGAPPVVREGAERSPVDWEGVALAVSRMVDDVRRGAEERAHRSEYVVVGQAPLPVFLHVGMALSAWAQPVTVLNRRKDGTWDRLAIAGASEGSFFDATSLSADAQPVEASGRVAVFISAGATVNRDLLHEFVRQTGDRIAGIVEVRPKAMKLLTSENASAVAQQLADLFASIAAAYPRRTGLAVFVAGPGPLAFLVGRAINPHLYEDIAVANFTGTAYEACFVLPFRGPTRGPLAVGSDAAYARAQALEQIRLAVRELQANLTADDFPQSMSVDERNKLVQELRELSIGASVSAEFSLSVLRRELLVGEPLLEVLRTLDHSALKLVGGLLTLHELYHVVQGIQSTNFHGIGRAGTALEQVDFFADAISVEALTRYSARADGAGRPVADQCGALIDAALLGMSAFDRAEAGSVMHRLPERRLRRYLIWHLQRQRASTIGSLEDLAVLFADRLVVELAPVRGFLDARFDKIAKEALPSTELVVALGPRIWRLHRRPGFDPGGLLEAVRTFDSNVVAGAMDFVMHEYRGLAQWKTTGVC